MTQERTGGSITVNDGKITECTAPTADHPEGNRARDAHGRPLDAHSRKPSEPPAVPMSAPAAAPSRRHGPSADAQ
jgi:hypothetical protein